MPHSWPGCELASPGSISRLLNLDEKMKMLKKAGMFLRC
jgi:hypothetical protein